MKDSVIKLKSYTGKRNDVLRKVDKHPKIVIDIGCSEGALGCQIKEKFPNAYVIGVEQNEEFIKVAKNNINEVIKLDLNNFIVPSIKEKADLLIFADVLEHTLDPELVLKSFLQIATDDVNVIISLPNIQHITAIFNLLMGRWPQRDRGLFDKTHLRYFTLDSIKKMSESCGLKILSISRNYRLLDSPEGYLNAICKRIAPYLPFKSLLTYQFVISLKRKDKIDFKD